MKNKSMPRLLCAFAALAISCGAAFAQPFPQKPVKLIVGFPPGGGVDIIARSISQRLGERLGQPIVIENRSGAGGNIAAELVAHAPADGYTLLVSAVSSLAISASLYKAAAPQIESGKLRALGVTSTKRSPLLPGVPTIAEAGLPGYQVLGSFGVMAPAGTPAEIVNRLNHEIAAVVNLPDVKDRLAKSAATPEQQSPEEFAQVLKAEVAKWAKIVDSTGVKLD